MTQPKAAATFAAMRTILTALLLAPLCAWAADPAPVDSREGMVVTAQHLASDVGAAILRQGGNAVDAAVAVGYALAVVYPEAGNLGGGGFMTLRLASGRTTFIDFREKAPGTATEKMYLDKNGKVIPGLSTDSWLSVGIPGSPAGLEYAREQYGTMKRAALMAPAIELARKGFTIGQGDAGIFQIATPALAKDPAAAAIFLKNGKPLQEGDTLVQPQLAHSLELISNEGPEAAFYKGPIGAAIAEASKQGGGIITTADLANYKVRELPPVECDYRGFHIISSPPPSSGGVMICEILQILQVYDLKSMGFHSADDVHYLVEAMRRAFADRRDLGDPAYVKNPVAELISPEHAAKLRAGIDPLRATPSAMIRAASAAPHEGTDTTQFSVVDSAGNAVSVTYTLNNWFGAQKVAGNTGIVMNDEMDDFTSKPGVPNMFGLIQGEANAIQPGKTPLSSMSPTILTKNGKLAMVIGSPGGSRIITITLEAILNVIDHGMTIQEAIDAPRIHEQWMPDMVFVERQALSPDTRALLASRGYTFKDAGYWGVAEGILVGGPSLAGHDGFGEDGFLPLNALPEKGAKYFGAHDVRGGAGKASAEEGLPIK
jgi:gamma-glutamyltranspeptidase/glutathione hydrolase